MNPADFKVTQDANVSESTLNVVQVCLKKIMNTKATVWVSAYTTQLSKYKYTLLYGLDWTHDGQSLLRVNAGRTERFCDEITWNVG